MRFITTRNHSVSYTYSEAIIKGLGPDGGLFVPEFFPEYSLDDFSADNSIDQMAFTFLKKFLVEDELMMNLGDICEKVFDIDVPIVSLDENTYLLELFHGPTGAFKDFGARFLSQCLGVLNRNLTVLVATSGDTGSAVAAAFDGIPNIQVIILYPKDKISQFQENQLLFWGGNIHPVRVNSDFDRCQEFVKASFADKSLNELYSLTSSNSINIGRLLPQCVYYVYASITFYRKKNLKINLVIPSGNMGNALAAIWAKIMGFPIEKIHLSTNTNRVLTDYFASGEFTPRASIPTLANAMDVGNPSNFERYNHLINTNSLQEEFISANFVTDTLIEETMKSVFDKFNIIIDPHTATTFHEKLEAGPWVHVATAHPSKFNSIVEEVIGQQITFPSQLERFRVRNKEPFDVENSLEAFQKLLQSILD